MSPPPHLSPNPLPLPLPPPPLRSAKPPKPQPERNVVCEGFIFKPGEYLLWVEIEYTDHVFFLMQDNSSSHLSVSFSLWRRKGRC